MNHDFLTQNNQDEVIRLFSSSFTDADGEEEGQFLGDLVSQLCGDIDNDEIIGIGAYEQERLTGSIFFTRLRFPHKIEVFMLSPVAVDTPYQRKGIGQALINHGLNVLRERHVAVVVTYGDPAFYSRVGFQHLSEDIIKAPQILSMPHGWLGQSLSDAPLVSLQGRPTCVEAFNNPDYW